jgi:hypothetical protein
MLLFLLSSQDVGQAVLESYSRVLETVASNLLAGICHVLDSHEEAYSLGKALRLSNDYHTNQDSPTSPLVVSAQTPPITPDNNSSRGSDPAGGDSATDRSVNNHVHEGGATSIRNPLQQWVVLEGRSSWSSQSPAKHLSLSRTSSTG